jgi:hypothetical protein
MPSLDFRAPDQRFGVFNFEQSSMESLWYLLVIVLDNWSRGWAGTGTHSMTNLLSALRLERKHIQRAIRNLEHDKRHPGPQKVIPIRRDILASDEDRDVADMAFDIWLSNGFRGGSPEEALMTAVRQSRTKAAGLSLVPRRKSNPHPLPALRLHSN